MIIGTILTKLNVFKGRDLSDKTIKNVLALFGLKGINVLISFLLVPIALAYLDANRYGIWITLSGMLNWFSLFDVGIANGLRFKLAHAVAQEDIKTSKALISTAYAILSIIFFSLFVLFIPISKYVNWSEVLNAHGVNEGDIEKLVLAVFFFICVRFIFQIISVVALANQSPALSQVIEVCGRLCALVAILLVTRLSNGGLFDIGLVLTGVPVVVTLIFTLVLFSSTYKSIRPSWRLVDFSYAKDLLNLGFKYFLIQIAAIVFFQTNTIIIAQLFGSERVTEYSLAFQYFSICTVIFLTLLTPYWSAFTNAYARSDFDWIKKVVRNLQLVWLFVGLIAIALLVFSKPIMILWVGEKSTVDFNMLIIMGVYTLVNAYTSIYSYFLNGVGKLNIQLYSSIFFALLHIPFSLFLSRYFGVNGIMISTILFAIIQIALFSFQYKLVMERNAKGIWSN